MFGRDIVGNFRRRRKIGNYRHITAVGYDFLEFFRPRKLQGEFVDFLPDGRHKLFGGGYEKYFFLAASVFGLRKEIGGNIAGICRCVRDNQNFAWAREQIAADFAEKTAFGFYYKSVAGAVQLVYRLYRLGANAHGRDCLRAADFINLRNAEHIQHAKNIRIYGTVL